MNLLKLSKIVKQIYKVAMVLEASLNSIINIDDSAGSHISDQLREIIYKVISGIQAVKGSIEKVSSFIGVDIDQIQASSIDIDKEIEELKKLSY